MPAKTNILKSAKKLSKLQIGLIAGLLAVAGIIYVLVARAGGAGGVMPLDWALDKDNPVMSESFPTVSVPYQACVYYQNTGTTNANFVFTLKPGRNAAPITYNTDVEPSSEEQSYCLDPSFKVPDGELLEVSARVNSGSVFVSSLGMGVTAFAPQNFRSTSQTTSSIVLEWDGVDSDPCSTDGCGYSPVGKAVAGGSVGPDRYRIYRARAGTNDYVAVVTTISRTFTDSRLASNTLYSYYAVQVDHFGTESNPSDPVVVSTKAVPVPNNPPNNLRVNDVSETAVQLAWNEPTTTVPRRYAIHRLDQPVCNQVSCTGTTDTRIGGTTSLNFNVTGLKPGSTYRFYVAAVYTQGGNPRSDIISVTTLDITAPTAPTGLKTLSRNRRSIGISWAASKDNSGIVTEYIVFRDGKEIGRASGSDFLATNLKPGKNYKFQVAAVDANGNMSALSSSHKVKTKAPDKKVKCGWTLRNGIPSYRCRPTR